MFVPFALAWTLAVAEADVLLLDDFGRDDGRSAIGTEWRAFTDRVMGGVSEMQTDIVDSDRGPALRMNGAVRLDNNGGFIQARLPLDGDGGTLDASAFGAVRVVVRGTPGAYYLHLRTPDTRRPWQYYRAQLPVDEEWRERTIPFDAFTGKSIDGTPDFSRLKSIAVVAYGESFDADIRVARLELVATD
ncbi:MAG: CIA30 family protein [Candidatus Wenzhouxiangella sp. M2_3B_020]